VLEHPVDDERDGLEAAVRMPLEARCGEPVLGEHEERIGARGVGGEDEQALVVDLRIGACVQTVLDAADGAGRGHGTLSTLHLNAQVQ
jgi:hypothetical protein